MTPPFNPSSMLQFQSGAISCKTQPLFKEKFKQYVSGCRGGLVIASIVANINTSVLALLDLEWQTYYAEVNIVGYLGGNKSVLARSATGQNASSQLMGFTGVFEDPSAGPVVYRWSMADGETWDEIAIEVREMTMGVPATPTFAGNTSHPEFLTLDLYVVGRVW